MKYLIILFSYILLNTSISYGANEKGFENPCSESELQSSLNNLKIFDNREKLCLVQALKIHFLEGWVGELSRLTPDEQKWFDKERFSKQFVRKFYGGDLENNKLFVKGMLFEQIDDIVLYLDLLKTNYLKLGNTQYDKKINIRIIRQWGSILEIISRGHIERYRIKLINLDVLKPKDVTKIGALRNPAFLEFTSLPHILSTIFIDYQR